MWRYVIVLLSVAVARCRRCSLVINRLCDREKDTSEKFIDYTDNQMCAQTQNNKMLVLIFEMNRTIHNTAHI